MGDDAATTHDDSIAHALAFFTRAMWHVASPSASALSTSFCVSGAAEADIFTTIHNDGIIYSLDLYKSCLLNAVRISLVIRLKLGNMPNIR